LGHLEEDEEEAGSYKWSYNPYNSCINGLIIIKQVWESDRRNSLEKDMSFSDYCSLIAVQPLKKHVAGCIVSFLLGLPLPRFISLKSSIFPSLGFQKEQELQGIAVETNSLRGAESTHWTKSVLCFGEDVLYRFITETYRNSICPS